jgi:phosphatidylserine decarboxylase
MTGDLPALSARMFVALQHLIPQHFLSSLVYRVTRSRVPAVKNALISGFMQGYHPDLSEAVQPDPLAYPSFNEFFTRALRDGARSIDSAVNTLVSPVDGTISQIGSLDGDNLLQAKGHSYSLQALLEPDAGTQRGLAQRFAGGGFATLYLAPFNYHRIHMPIASTLRAAWYVPGNLFSVNATTAAAVAGLFARNERIVCLFEDGSLSFVMVLVGALFVGSMATVWHGEVTPRNPRSWLELPLDASRAPLSLDKGAEMGRFNMGSTVIVLVPPDTADWLTDLKPGGRIRVGQPLAQLTSRTLARPS